MRNLFMLFAIGGLFFVIGCVDQPLDEAGSSTQLMRFLDSDAPCCAAPDQEPPACCAEPNNEPKEDPVESVNYEPSPLNVASGDGDAI